MRYKFLLLLIIPVLILSCKKEEGTVVPPPPVTPPPAQQVLLKDIVVPNLPAPYYHFKYLSTGKMIFASFASEFTMYDFEYNGDRMSEMKNNTAFNQDRVQYFYDNAGRVGAVMYEDANGEIFTINNLTYDGRQLIKLTREKKTGANFILDKTMKFQYYPDGNLRELSTLLAPSAGHDELTFKTRYEQYDNKINVDAFTLLHNDFFDHLVLLPGVQIQKNNPGKITRTGDGENYQIDYTYTYNEKNAPLTRTGIGIWLNGQTAGEAFQSNTLFSYY